MNLTTDPVWLPHLHCMLTPWHEPYKWARLTPTSTLVCSHLGMNLTNELDWLPCLCCMLTSCYEPYTWVRLTPISRLPTHILQDILQLGQIRQLFIHLVSRSCPHLDEVTKDDGMTDERFCFNVLQHIHNTTVILFQLSATHSQHHHRNSVSTFCNTFTTTPQ